MPPPRTAPRWLAMRVAALAVGCYRENVAFTATNLDPAADLPGLDRTRSRAMADIEALALIAEARSRDLSLDRLLDRVAGRRDGLLAVLPDGTDPDRVLARAREAINAPKVWAAMGALARALQARTPLPFAEVMVIVGRILEAAETDEP